MTTWIWVPRYSDINGDGYPDIVIGAPFASYEGNVNVGAVYVIFGTTTFQTNINLETLSSTQGFIIKTHSSYDIIGISVSGAGDINNDGYDDIVIGAYYKTYIIYGKSSLTDIDLSNLTGSQGISITNAAGDHRVSAAGDVNNDGYADIFIGANLKNPNGRSYAGTSYIIYGGRSLTNINLFNLDQSKGISIFGAQSYSYSGLVSGAGDVNNDGYDDVIIGATNASPFGRYVAGESYVRYIDLAYLTIFQGFKISGGSAGDYGGRVSGIGDFNKDGYDDVVVCAHQASALGREYAGRCYVLYGGQILNNIDLLHLNPTNGFSVYGAVAYDYAMGLSVSGGGDVNSDGYKDIIIGAPNTRNGQNQATGACFVIYGSNSTNDIDLAHLKLN